MVRQVPSTAMLSFTSSPSSTSCAWMTRPVGSTCLSVPTSSTIPVNIFCLLRWLCSSKYLNRSCHLYCGLGTLLATGNPLFCLLLILGAHHPKNDRHARVECHALNALGCSVTYQDIMTGLAFHHAAETDKGIIGSSSQHGPGRGRKFVGTGCRDHVYIFNPETPQFLLRKLEHGAGDVPVVACHHDPDRQSRAIQLRHRWLCSCLHLCSPPIMYFQKLPWMIEEGCMNSLLARERVPTHLHMPPCLLRMLPPIEEALAAHWPV